MCYFIGLQVLLSAIICVSTIFSPRLCRKDENEPVPFWISRLFRKDNNKNYNSLVPFRINLCFRQNRNIRQQDVYDNSNWFNNEDGNPQPKSAMGNIAAISLKPNDGMVDVKNREHYNSPSEPQRTCSSLHGKTSANWSTLSCL